jgi:type II secretory pathway pseudopilin PulG
MRRARNEEGFAVVAAVVLLTVIMGLGLGLLLFTDSQQKASTREQASEAAFNVAEAALNAQVGQLSRKWPFYKTEAEANAEMPRVCTSSTSTEANDCPSPTDLKVDPNTGSTACPGTDAWGSPLSNQWTTYVRRDLTEGSGESVRERSLFNSTEEHEQPSYAESEGGALWVRSVGVVQCHPVSVITLVTRLRVSLPVPVDAIAGNWFEVTNKGNKAIVNREGYASGPAPVSMRCEGHPSEEECEKYDRSKEQVSPTITEDPKTSTTTLTTSQLATVKSEAQAHGTFYSSTSPYHCPTSMSELEGVKLSTSSRAPVYIEGCGALNIKANGTANCEGLTATIKPSLPGFLVIANGTLELSGNSTYCGVIYAANLQKSSGAVVKLQGGTVVVGGIIVDGAGGIEFGSSGAGGNPANLVFDSLAFHNLTISAGAASTRNSFRILPAGQ